MSAPDREIIPLTAKFPAGIPEDRDVGLALSFFVTPTQDAALNACDYTVQAEFQVLADLARNDPNPAIRLAAVKMIREHLREALGLAGQIAQATARRTQTLQDGQQVSEEITGYRLRGIGKETERLLIEASRIGDIIALENKDDDTEYAEGPEAEQSDAPADETPETSPVRPGQPERDIGGGGLCRSSQREARSAARLYHDTKAGTDDQVPGTSEVPPDPAEGLQHHSPLPVCNGGRSSVPLADPPE